MKIPIREIIKSSARLECNTRDRFSEPVLYRMRLKSFHRVNVESLTALLSRHDSGAGKQLQMSLKRDDGVLWFLGVDVVNLNRREVEPDRVTDPIILVDHEDYEFRRFEFPDLMGIRWGAHSTLDGLQRFIYGGDLKPKIRTEGIVPFMLPTDDPDEYFVSCTGGDIREV